MKKLLFAATICLTTLCGCTNSSLPKQIEDQIAAGDTIPEGGINGYLINGTAIAPEMYTKALFLVLPDISMSGAPDSELYIVLNHGNSVATTKKEALAILFPDANDFFVDGKKVTKDAVDRLPASLISEVNAENGGKTLRITSRDNVNAPGVVSDAINHESEMIRAVGPTPLEASDIIITDFSTYPDTMRVNIDGYMQSMETLRALPKNEISSIQLTTYCGMPFVNIYTSQDKAEFTEPTEPLKLADMLADESNVVFSIIYHRDGSVSDVKLPRSIFDKIAGRWDQIDSLGIDLSEE